MTTEETTEDRHLNRRLEEMFDSLQENTKRVDTMQALQRVRGGETGYGASQRALVILTPVLLIIGLVLGGVALTQRAPTNEDPLTLLGEHPCGSPGPSPTEEADSSQADEMSEARLTITSVESEDNDMCRRSMITFNSPGDLPVEQISGLQVLDDAIDNGKLVFDLPPGIVVDDDMEERFSIDAGFTAIVGDHTRLPRSEDGSWLTQTEDGSPATIPPDDPSQKMEIVVDHGSAGTTSWTVLANPLRLVISTSYGDGEQPELCCEEAALGRSHVISVDKTDVQPCCGVEVLAVGAFGEGSGLVELYALDTGEPVEATWSIISADGTSYEPTTRNQPHQLYLTAGSWEIWDWTSFQINGLAPGRYRLEFHQTPDPNSAPTTYDFSIHS